MEGCLIRTYFLPNLSTILMHKLSEIQTVTWIQEENISVSVYIEKTNCGGKALTAKVTKKIIVISLVVCLHSK